MKNIIWLVILLPMLGCANMSEQDKRTAYIVGSILVAGAVISANDNDSSKKQNCYITGPIGSSGTMVCR